MKTFEDFREHHQKDAQGRVVEHGDGTPSSVEEENALERRAKENEKARKWLKKDAKDSGYTDIALKASMSKGAGVSEDYYRGTGEKVVARTKKWMDKKGQQGAPGLDAMKARTAEHKAKRGVKEEIVTELNRYGKETGKATGSLNKRAGTPVKRGGGSDKALNFVRNMIRKETGKPEGQQKKVKGEKGRVQYGDRKVSPSTTIAKRRQAAKDADAAMRDTRGT